MTTAAIQSEEQFKHRLTKSKKEEKISWANFEKNYLSREDGYKYEWLNGIIEKTTYSMNKTQLYILRNLQAYVRTLYQNQNITGELIAEADLFFDENHRRPDICWLTNKQIDNLALDKNEVPSFVIEIISTNDVMNKVVHKMQDYRAAKVQVVWHILPNYEEVHVYTGKDLAKMAVLKGKKLCSAAPALPEFKIAVSDIFKINKK